MGISVQFSNSNQFEVDSEYDHVIYWHDLAKIQFQ